jgi:hypothetical protein
VVIFATAAATPQPPLCEGSSTTPRRRVLYPLVTDEPRCVSANAVAAPDELSARRRFRQVELTFRDYAALDALQAVVGLAISGDIEVEVDTSSATYKRVTADEIVASYHRQDRFRRNRLLGEILAAPRAAPAEPCEALSPASANSPDASHPDR